MIKWTAFNLQVVRFRGSVLDCIDELIGLSHHCDTLRAQAAPETQLQVKHEGGYQHGYYRDPNANIKRRFFAVKVSATPPMIPAAAIRLGWSAGLSAFRSGRTLVDPGVFRFVELKPGDTLVLGVYSNDAQDDTWFAVRRVSEPEPFEIYTHDLNHRTSTKIAGDSVQLSTSGQIWFRVYLFDDEVRFAFLPDNPVGHGSFRLAGKYYTEPIKASGEQFSYLAVMVQGDFNPKVASEARDMAVEIAQRHRISLANPGLPQEFVRLDRRYLVVIAFDAARNASEWIAVKFLPDGSAQTMKPDGSLETRVDFAFPHEAQLGGFRIPFAFQVRPDFELSYSVGFPH